MIQQRRRSCRMQRERIFNNLKSFLSFSLVFSSFFFFFAKAKSLLALYEVRNIGQRFFSNSLVPVPSLFCCCCCYCSFCHIFHFAFCALTRLTKGRWIFPQLNRIWPEPICTQIILSATEPHKQRHLPWVIRKCIRLCTACGLPSLEA